MADNAGEDNDSTAEFAELDSRRDGPRVRLETSALTNTGLARENNEDAFLVARLARSIAVEATSLPSDAARGHAEQGGHLIIVADGMGGVGGGERASALAVQSIRSFLLDGFRSFLHGDKTDEAALLRELKASFDRADRVVIRDASSDPKLDGMGTTLTVGYGIADTLYILHAGDSRAYLMRGGVLTQVTTDHTLVQMLVASGTISVDDARGHPQRNIVTNVVGGPGEGVNADVHKLALEDGDLLLFCSDGLTEPVDDATVAAILGRCTEPSTTARELVDEALRRGGPDNVTVVVTRVRIEA